MRDSLTDFHVHLDLFPDPVAAFAACEKSGIDALAVTTTPLAWPRNRDLSRGTRHVRAALGLHPELVASRADEIDVWERFLPEADFVGEVGLDGAPQHRGSFPMQRKVFERILRCCAETSGKILTVHSRRAATQVLDLVESHLPVDRGSVVLHWFTGSAAEARRAVDLGCYFSINTAMMRSERGQALVGALPMSRLLTETDAPFVKVNERAAEPSDVSLVADALAHVYGVDSSTMRNHVRSNTRCLLARSGASDWLQGL